MAEPGGNRGGWALVVLGHLVAWLPKDFDRDDAGPWAPLLGNVSLWVAFSDRSERLLADLQARAAADEEWQLGIRELFREMREAVGHADRPDFAPWLKSLWPDGEHQQLERLAAEPGHLLGRWLDLLEAEFEQRLHAREWAGLVAEQRRIWWSTAASVLGEAASRGSRASHAWLPLVQRLGGRLREETRRLLGTVRDQEVEALREQVRQLEARLERLEAQPPS